MVKKRDDRRGRPRDPNKKVMFSTRLEPHVLAALKAAAKTWPGRNLSTLAEHLIDKGLREREEERRDPALRALFYIVTQMANYLTNIVQVEDKKHRHPTSWRTDRLFFKAFKVAVRQLLDALEEPPKSSPAVDEIRREAAARASGGSPELNTAFHAVFTSPEKLGAYIFTSIWERATMVDPADFPPEIKAAWAKRQVYHLIDAVRDLELKPSKTDGGKP
jgi:hypothetical protein